LLCIPTAKLRDSLFSLFGDQISVVYHYISSSVWIVFGSGFFLVVLGMRCDLILDETVTADHLAEDKIDRQNCRYSGSRPRPAASSEAEDNMMVVVVVVVVQVVEWFEFGDGRGQNSSDGMCL
jgi:hypothetical protein